MIIFLLTVGLIYNGVKSECLGVKEEKVTLSGQIRENVEVDIQGQFLALIEIMILARSSEFEVLESGLVKATIESQVCQLGGDGLDLEEINKLDDTGMTGLINTILIKESDKLLLTSDAVTVIADKETAGQVWDALHIEDNIDYTATTYELVYSEGVVTNIGNSGDIVCQGNILLKNQFMAMREIFENINHLFEEIKSINKLLSNDQLELGLLQECLGDKDILEFSSYFAIPLDTLKICLTSSKQARSKRSSILTYLFADGRQTDKLQNNLVDTVAIFNRNFQKISSSENTIKLDLGKVHTDVTSLVLSQDSIREKLLERSVLSTKAHAQSKYMIIQQQHYQALQHLLKSSQMSNTLLDVRNALMQKTGKCTQSKCVVHAYVTSSTNKVQLHKEYGELVHMDKVEISCKPISENRIPKYHGLLGTADGPDLLFAETAPVTWTDLKNETFLQGATRFIVPSDLILNSLLFHESDTELYFTCMKEILVVMASRTIQCKVLQTIQIEDKNTFTLVTKDGQVSASHVRKKIQPPPFAVTDIANIKDTLWSKEPTNYDLIQLQSLPKFLFLNEAGDVSPAKVSLGVGGILIFLAIILCCCCWCCRLCPVCTGCLPANVRGCCSKQSAREDLRAVLARLESWVRNPQNT